MKRREFVERILSSVTLLPVGAALLTGCGDDDGGTTPPDPPTCELPDGGVCSTFDAGGSSNTHGHLLTVTAAQIAACATVSIPSTGGDHPHTVTLTDEDLDELATGCTVTVTSNDSHAHTWVISFI